jgi:hypothetical protein
MADFTQPTTPSHANGVGYPRATAEQIERATVKTPPARTPPSTLLDVAKRWRSEGPLVHEPTGIAKLDELTGGGPVYGSRWYVLGAPDAGKTALLVQVADDWQASGIVVGVLAVDEEDGDLTMRFAQRRKFRRDECERRSEETMGEMEDAFVGSFGLFMYGPDWTIEAAAADLAERGKSLAKEGEPPRRLALFVDSIQQARCDALEDTGANEPSPREVVNENVRALRKVAAKYRLIAMATGEMNRNAYRNIKSAEEANDMAAAKESGAVEYSARVLVAMRSVKDHGDLVELRMVKNKHGPSWPAANPFYLNIDRRTMMLASASAPDDDAKDDEKAHSRNRAALEREAIPVLNVIAQNPGCGTKALRAALKLAGVKTSRDGLDVLLEALARGGRLEDRQVKKGTQLEHHYHAVSGPEATS